MSILSYSLISASLIGVISALYLHFTQKQSPILRFVSWSFIISGVFVLILKNILFESYIIRSTFDFLFPFSLELELWGISVIHLICWVMKGSFIIVVLGFIFILIVKSLAVLSNFVINRL
ncbi:MAG: hypothetical protein Q4Q00_10115 [Turicibacter sp.]|nr:hypothetical protein [Turicibacter sp.]